MVRARPRTQLGGITEYLRLPIRRIRGSDPKAPEDNHVPEQETDGITAPELAVNRQVEECEFLRVSLSTRGLAALAREARMEADCLVKWCSASFDLKAGG